MVKLNFSVEEMEARGIKPATGDWTPYEFALRLWMNLTEFTAEPSSPAEAIERAGWFPDDWHDLRDWMQANEADLSDEWKLATFHLWLHEPPNKPRSNDTLPTGYRNWALNHVASRLCEKYSLTRTQTQPGGPAVCAASVLAELPGTPSEGQIANLLNR